MGAAAAGRHYPSDVLAGAATGGVAAAVAPFGHAGSHKPFATGTDGGQRRVAEWWHLPGKRVDAWRRVMCETWQEHRERRLPVGGDVVRSAG